MDSPSPQASPRAHSDSNDSSGSSSISYIPSRETLSPETSTPRISALRRPFENLESIMEYPNFIFRSDAKIVFDRNREIPVHRSILSVRSPFFKNLFYGSTKRRRGWKLEFKELTKDFDVGFDSLVFVLAYLYSGKVKSSPEGVCICVDDECSHIGCWPAVNFMVEVVYVSFIFQILELVSLYEGRLLDILNKVVVDDILVILFVANKCNQACDRLLKKCIEIVVQSDIDVVTLEHALPNHIVRQILSSRFELGLFKTRSSHSLDRYLKRIHRALDLDDVERVRFLLKEVPVNLDDAYALHYAVAYTDAKTVTKLLDLGFFDVNRRNPRGYLVLHVAAMRKEPDIIVSLLTKGALPSDVTPDGKTALQISKRVTRFVDYNRPTEEGKASHKDRLCIEVLERAERREPLFGESSVFLAMPVDDPLMKLFYLEIRVSLSKLLFPAEAKLAMDIAHVPSSWELQPFESWNSPAGQSTPINLNESRMNALTKSVEIGKRYFPHCSKLLDKIMEVDLMELAYLGDTAEERLLKKGKYFEMKNFISKEFIKDKEEFNKSALSHRLYRHKGPMMGNVD